MPALRLPARPLTYVLVTLVLVAFSGVMSSRAAAAPAQPGAEPRQVQGAGAASPTKAVAAARRCRRGYRRVRVRGRRVCRRRPARDFFNHRPRPRPQPQPRPNTTALLNAARNYGIQLGSRVVEDSRHVHELDPKYYYWSVQDCAMLSDSQARCTLYLWQELRNHPFWDYFLWGYERVIHRQFTFAPQRDWGIGVAQIGGTGDPYRVICTDITDRRHQGIPLCLA